MTIKQLKQRGQITNDGKVKRIRRETENALFNDGMIGPVPVNGHPDDGQLDRVFFLTDKGLKAVGLD